MTSDVEKIAALLGETKEKPKLELASVLSSWGFERTHQAALRALDIERTGGMRNRSGKRQRTLGGIFFHIVKTEAREGEGIPGLVKPRRKDWVPVPLPKKTTWKDLLALLEKAETQTPGEISNMKLTFTMRPKTVVPYDASVFLLISQAVKVNALPKGLPKPPAAAKYAVFVAAKQWRKVEQALRDSEDALLVDGVPVFDASFRGITVLAMSVRSKKQEAARRLAQIEAAAAKG